MKALNLINLSKHAERAIEIVIENMPNGAYRSAEHQSREILFNRIQDPEHRNRIIEASTIQTMLHQAVAGTEGGFWLTGSKAHMIKCISYLDTRIALDACLQCIRDHKAKDRFRYPALLLEIEPGKAVNVLIDELRKQKSVQMRQAIIRALIGCDVDKRIMELSASANYEDRRAACELAGISESDESNQILNRMLVDDSDEVIKTSIAALQSRRDAKVIAALTNRIDAESDRRSKNSLIDCYVNVCRAGEPHSTLTKKDQDVLRSLSDYEWERSKERLKKRIEKREKALERKDK